MDSAARPRRAAPRGARSRTRAGVAIRQQRALDVGDHKRAPGDRDRGKRATRWLASRIDLEPRRRHHDRQLRSVPAGGHRQRQTRHLRRDPLDLEALEIGCRVLERLLDRELKRDRRGRAVRAASLQPDPRDPVVERQQLDVSSVRVHVRPHRVKRALHALLERDRVEVVDQQQGRDQRILGELRCDSRSVGPRGEDPVEDPLQAAAVELQDRGHEFLGQVTRRRLLAAVQERLQLLDALEQGA